MIIYDPKITGSFQINGSTISSVGEIDNLSGSVAALNNASSSYLLNTTDVLNGNLTVTGTLTAQEFHTEYTSASIVYQSGSTKFGDTDNDDHEFQGIINITRGADRKLSFTDTRGGKVWTIEHDPNQIYFWNKTDSESPLSIQNDGDVVMNAGNVGIGTSNPSYPLHVRTAENENFLVLSDTGIRLSAFNDAISAVQPLKFQGDPVSFLGSGGVEKMRFTVDGNLTLGTTSSLNTYSGMTISGENPSLALETSTSSGWVWTQYVNSSGTNNFSMGVNQTLPYWAVKAGAGLDSPNLVVDSSGRVGIGATGLTNTLHVHAEEPIIRINSTVSTAAKGLYFTYNNTLYSKITHNANSGQLLITSGESGMTGYYMDFNINGGNAMRIDSSRRVGIGTTSPSQQVTIETDSSVYNALELRDSRSKASTPESALVFRGRYSGAAINTMGIIVGAYDNATDANTTSNMQFYINNGASVVQAMKLQNDSSLAIANGAQSTNTVSSQIIFGNRGYFSNPAVGGAKIVSVTGSPNWYSSTSLAFYTNPGSDVTATAPIERMRIVGSGQVNIGNNDSGALRFFNSGGSYIGGIGTNYWAFGGSYSTSDLGIIGPNNVYLGVNSGPVMLISSGGNVGIGTTSPGAKLHVNGDFSLNSTYHGEKVFAFGPGSSFSIDLPSEFPGMALVSGNVWMVIGDLCCFGAGGSIEVRTFYIGRNAQGTWSSTQYSASGANTGASLQSVTGSSNSITINMNTGSYLTVKLNVMIR